MPMTKEPSGTARLSLTITTEAKRGKKMVKNVVVYTVTDLRPDKRVADPAYRLSKENGESWDVAIEKWGPTCSCPHATFRGANSRVPCKHIKACQAVGLLPRSG